MYVQVPVAAFLTLEQTIATAKALKQKMTEAGHAVSAIYGGGKNFNTGARAEGMTGEERDRVIEEFRQGKFSRLFSTTHVVQVSSKF